MDLNHYEKIIKSEATARRYLLGFCWKNHQRHCPQCRSRKLYTLGSGKKRCARCKYTFHDFSRRFINSGQLTCRQWLRIIKLFELDVPSPVIIDQMGLAANTVYKALNAIRRAILAHSLDASLILEAHPLLVGGASAKYEDEESEDQDQGTPPPVFGIVERKGWVFADFMTGMNAESLIHFKLNFQLKLSSLGKIVYTDRFRQYAALMTAGDYIRRHCPFKTNDQGLFIDSSNKFWQFARGHLGRFKGVTSERFALYIKEMEFRYNHRHGDVFSTVARYLCALVPNREKQNLS